MKFSQPLVLLLGCVLSESGMGCSAITAVGSDSRAANRENRSDADRLAAIGRVFENQGRYDKAEVMYREALRNRPQDSEIRHQLQQLAARRDARQFGPAGTGNAIGIPDIVSPPKSRVPQAHSHVSTASETSRAGEDGEANSNGGIAVGQQSPIPVSQLEAIPVVPIASIRTNASTQIELTLGGNDGSLRSGILTSDR